MAPHIDSKVDGDFSGGGGSYNITRPTRREKQHAADMVIYLRHRIPCRTSDHMILEVGKDRNGIAGVKELPEAIDAIADLLARYKFQGGNKMFQMSLKLRLIEAMKEVLIGDDVVPTQQAVLEYVKGGEIDGQSVR